MIWGLLYLYLVGWFTAVIADTHEEAGPPSLRGAILLLSWPILMPALAILSIFVGDEDAE